MYLCVFQERFGFFLSANMQMSRNRSVLDRGLVAELTFVRLNDLAAPPEPVHLAVLHEKQREKYEKIKPESMPLAKDVWKKSTY